LKDEKQLIEALQSGSEKAFRMLVDDFQEKVLNTCLGFLPNVQDAEDLTQEVFVEVFRSVGKFRGEAKLSTWVYRIAVTKSLEKIRSRKRHKRMAFFQSLIGLEDKQAKAIEDNFNHPGVQLENKERAKVLFQTIGELPKNQRIAFTLHKVEGMNHKEICEIMELSVSAIESLLFRAKRNLKKQLFDYYKNQMI
jgi:RNA polymerase sigma factor (sigma-70 family)